MRNHRWQMGLALLFLGGVVALFLKDFWLMRGTFNLGDYGQQHYPWAEFYASELKAFRLPLWTPLMHGGFPLLAEGQIGALYPPNLLLFFLLPFPLSYTLSILLHFFCGGFFLYLYGRHVGLSFWAACAAALVWLFGSAYAGVEYNLMTMRVLIWLPLALWLVERLVEKQKLRDALLLAPVYALQMTAGYTQYAFYAIAVSSLYFLVFMFIRPWGQRAVKSWAKPAGFYMAACALAVGMACIQLLPSLELSQQTLRLKEATLDFALLGSYPPLAFFSFIFPNTTGTLSGFRLYLGAISVFLIILSFFSRRAAKSRSLIFFCFAGLALFFSLGSLNPIYKGLVSWFHLYFFRTPAKFTIFACFFMSLLAGLGFDTFLKRGMDPVVQKARRWYGIIVAAASTLFLISHFALIQYKDVWIQWGRAIVDRYVVNQPFHHYTRAVYYEKVASIYEGLRDSFSLNAANLWTFLFLGLVLAALYILPKFGKHRQWLIALLLADLFVFSFYATGFRGNIGPIDRFQRHELFGRATDGRFYVYAENAEAAERLNLQPNTNMALGLSMIGAYSPLITTGLTRYLAELGNTDDSLGHIYTNKEAFRKKFERLSLANVKYIYAAEPIQDGRLTLLQKMPSGNLIYLNREVLPRAYFTEVNPKALNLLSPGLTGGFTSPVVPAEWKEIHSQKMVIRIDAPQSGWLVLSDLDYPGWQAVVDGQWQKIIRANKIFRAVELSEGRHEIRFEYRPHAFKQGAMISLVSLMLLILLFGLSLKSSKRRY